MSTYACCLVPSASPKRHCHCHCRFLRHMLHCRLQLVSLCAQRATYITVTATITITCCTVASDWCRFVPNVPPTALSRSPSLAALPPAACYLVPNESPLKSFTPTAALLVVSANLRSPSQVLVRERLCTNVCVCLYEQMCSSILTLCPSEPITGR
jgi:hypothetical protein